MKQIPCPGFTCSLNLWTQSCHGFFIWQDGGRCRAGSQKPLPKEHSAIFICGCPLQSLWLMVFMDSLMSSVGRESQQFKEKKNGYKIKSLPLSCWRHKICKIRMWSLYACGSLVLKGAQLFSMALFFPTVSAHKPVGDLQWFERDLRVGNWVFVCLFYLLLLFWRKAEMMLFERASTCCGISLTESLDVVN